MDREIAKTRQPKSFGLRRIYMDITDDGYSVIEHYTIVDEGGSVMEDRPPTDITNGIPAPQRGGLTSFVNWYRSDLEKTIPVRTPR